MNRHKGRVVVVESIYCQQPGEEAKHSEVRFSRRIDSTEQMYERVLRVNEDWVALDTGWVGNECSMVSVKNSEGTRFNVQPSEEELKELYSRVVEISFRGDGVVDAVVNPGESCRVKPANISAVKLRCPVGGAKVNLKVLPA